MTTIETLKNEIKSLATKLESTTDLNEKERLISLMDRLYFLYSQMKNNPDFGGSDVSN